SPGALFSFPMVSARRPKVAEEYFKLRLPSRETVPSVLVVGTYFADRPTNVHDIVRQVSRRNRARVSQSWAALGGDPMTEDVAKVTDLVLHRPMGKWEIANDL